MLAFRPEAQSDLIPLKPEHQQEKISEKSGALSHGFGEGWREEMIARNMIE